MTTAIVVCITIALAGLSVFLGVCEWIRSNDWSAGYFRVYNADDPYVDEERLKRDGWVQVGAIRDDA